MLSLIANYKWTDLVNSAENFCVSERTGLVRGLSGCVECKHHNSINNWTAIL